MSCGRVLGVYDGRLLEYEPSTLAPLGLVVGQDELKDKQVVVVGSGIEECKVGTAAISTQEGMEGADCADNEGEEQAVLLVDQETGAVTVVQPNEDGSYWRKIVRNKMIRMKEKRRVQAAQAYADEAFEEMDESSVVSSWGPYTSISGTATKTGVAGLTAKSKLTEKETDKATANWQKLNAPFAGGWASSGGELAKAFGDLDVEGSGSIEIKDLALAIQAAQPGIDDAKVAGMLALIDEDGDGTVTLQEFAMLMLFQAPPAKVPA